MIEEQAEQVKPEDLKEIGEKWMGRIRDALKRDERWRKDAEAAEKAYSQDESNDTGKLYDFNILHSNVETIVPALYNSTPVPDVCPVQGEKDGGQYALLNEAAKVYETCIAAMIDDNVLDAEIEDSTIGAELAGRGVVRVRFDADVETFTETREEIDPETGYLALVTETYEVPTNERVVFEAVPWRDYIEGPARRFQQVPWVAFRLVVMSEDFDQFDQAYLKAQPVEDDRADSEHTVWEVWCKKSSKVYFIRESDSALLMEQEDPLGLPGFFPVHNPVEPLQVPGRRQPIVPFTIYRTLADELDRTTARINAIMKGIKVRGGVIGDAENIARVADANDNELVPIENVEGLAQTGGLDKAIVWWPIEQAVRVVHELYIAREQTKQAIYEITGISDIVRGAGSTKETATAQQIKTQWGSLRIQKRQRLIERQVRDLFVMTCGLVGSKFSDERINELVGYPVQPEVLQMMRAGLKQYQVNVESDSTIRGDISRMKGEMAQFLEGTAAFFKTMAPIVAQVGAKGAAPAINLYAPFARMFSLGKQGEAALESMIQLAEEAAKNPEAGQMKQMQQQMQMLMAQLEMQDKKAEVQAKQQDLSLKEREAQRADMTAQADVAAMVAKAQNEKAQTDIERMSRAADLQMEAMRNRPVKIGGDFG